MESLKLDSSDGKFGRLLLAVLEQRQEGWRQPVKKKQNRYKSTRRKPGRVLSRLFMPIVWVCCFLGIIGLFSAALAHSYHALLRASWPQIKEIEVVGLHHIERKEVLDLLGVPRGANLFSVRAAQLADRLQPLPWLRAAVVRLDVAGKLVVEVNEREPMAVVHAGEFYLLDTQGKLFSKAPPSKYPDLPLVTGYTRAEVGDDLQLRDNELAILRSLISALQKTREWFPLRHISECRWQRRGGFTLYTTQGGIPIQLGADHFDDKLARLHKVFTLLMERNYLDAVKRIDVDYSNRVYVQGLFSPPKGI